MLLKSTLISSALVFAINADSVYARTFTDAKGVKHTTLKDKPKVVMFGHRAVSMRHYGLDETQFVASYGEWYNSGSDVDVDNPEQGSSLPADPLYGDIQFLQKAVDLSPGCHVGYCTQFDLDGFMNLEEVDEFIIHGYRGAWWGFNETFTETVLKNTTEKMGKAPIYLEMSRVSDDGSPCPDTQTNSSSTCVGLSLIDLIEENYELAQYLNLEIPESINDGRDTLCNSAAAFQKNMKTAHSKGIRLMPGYLSTTTSYIADAVSDSVLRMFEELGMPIMHIGSCMDAGDCAGNYFWEYMPLDIFFKDCPEGEVAASCNTNTYYPVDGWLYDHRTTLKVTDPEFAVGFPDKAITSGQMVYWPIGARLISPLDAAEILDIIGPKIAAMDRLHPPTSCKSNVDVSSTAHKTTGLAGGEYACFDEMKFHNTKYFETCHFFKTTTIIEEPKDDPKDQTTKEDPNDDPNGSSSLSAITAIAGFGAVAAVLVML